MQAKINAPLLSYLQNNIEALIFCAPEPITLAEIQKCVDELLGTVVPEIDIYNALEAIIEKYNNADAIFGVVKVAGGYQFLTRAAYQEAVNLLLKHQSKKRLSTSAMETLAIIAYKQPVTRAEIEKIRGVSCEYAIQRLLEKDLVEIKGKSAGLGRPMLYATSRRFMEYFGIDNLADLPQLKDFNSTTNEIGDNLG